MKAYYYTMIILAFLALATAVILPFTLPVIFSDVWPMLLCAIVGIPLLILASLGIEARGKQIQTMCCTDDTPAEASPENMPKNDNNADSSSSVAPQSLQLQEPDTVEHDKAPEVTEDCMEQKWSKAMYIRYNAMWDDLFDNIQIPLTPDKKAEISWLLWEIASQTVNFLKQSNADINSVGYNAEAVRMIIENLSEDDIKLEKFFDDPSTVQIKAIAIYKWLHEQGVKTATTAFGYQLKAE
jgi:hypothetical protein